MTGATKQNEKKTKSRTAKVRVGVEGDAAKDAHSRVEGGTQVHGAPHHRPHWRHGGVRHRVVDLEHVAGGVGRVLTSHVWNNWSMCIDGTEASGTVS